MISRTVFSRNTSLTPTNQKAKLAILCASVCVLSMLTPPGASAQTCAAPAAGAVNLCSPVTGAPISNASNPDLTVTAKATAPPGKTIAQTQAFIDGVAKTVQTGGTYSAMYNLPLGSHTVFVQAKTNTGTLINSPTVSIVIASGSYSAFTGTNYVAQPTPPAVGPGSAPWYTGTGMIVTDTFGTFVKQIARVTDANTHSNQSFQTAEEGNRTLWNKDSTFLLIANNAGGKFVVPFNPATLAVGSLGARFGANVTFSYQTPNVIYVQEKVTYTGGGTYTEAAAPEIDQVTLDANGNVTAATKVFNFLTDSSHCLKQVLTTDYNPPTWSGELHVSADDTAFVVAFSKCDRAGFGCGQESGHVITNYVLGKGCRILDTNPPGTNLTVDGDWGPVGNTPETDHFYLHEAGQTKNSAYATAGTPAAACVSGNCTNANLGKYIWQTATLNIASCFEQNQGPPVTAGSCPGHAAGGFLHYLNGTYATHLFSDQSHELIHELGIPTTNGGINQAGIKDEHGTWVNADTQDSFPAFYSSTYEDNPSTGAAANPSHFAFFNEIYAIVPSSYSIPDWTATHTYTANTLLYPRVGNAGNYQFRSSAGTSGANEPTVWPQTVGGTLTDGTVTWTNASTVGSTMRFTHTFNSGTNANFDALSAIGSVSQDGNFLAFTSDWMGNLGSEQGIGTTCNPVTASPLASLLTTTVDWAPSHAYKLGNVIFPTVGNAAKNGFQVTVAGTSGDMTHEPAWPTTRGTTVTDNGVTWTNVGINCRSDIFVVKLR